MKKTYEILQDFKGSPDGYTVIQYTKGQDNVELTDSLAKTALEEKWAKVSKTAEKQAKEKAKAEAEAEAKAKQEEADRLAKIQTLKKEIAQLEADGAAALEADPTGETAKPIHAEWQTKQDELAALQE